MARYIAVTILALVVAGAPMTAFSENIGTARLQPQTRIKQETMQSNAVVRSNVGSNANLAPVESCISWIASIFSAPATSAACACSSSPCPEILIIGVGF